MPKPPMVSSPRLPGATASDAVGAAVPHATTNGRWRGVGAKPELEMAKMAKESDATVRAPIGRDPAIEQYAQRCLCHVGAKRCELIDLRAFTTKYQNVYIRKACATLCRCDCDGCRGMRVDGNEVEDSKDDGDGDHKEATAGFVYLTDFDETEGAGQFEDFGHKPHDAILRAIVVEVRSTYNSGVSGSVALGLCGVRIAARLHLASQYIGIALSSCAVGGWDAVLQVGWNRLTHILHGNTSKGYMAAKGKGVRSDFRSARQRTNFDDASDPDHEASVRQQLEIDAELEKECLRAEVSGDPFVLDSAAWLTPPTPSPRLPPRSPTSEDEVEMPCAHRLKNASKPFSK